jgi:thiamine kinase-like enzyme
MDSCKAFGTEAMLLNHPDTILRDLIRSAYEVFEQQQFFYDSITPTLIHSDATPSNILAHGDDVGLIDWEFSKFNDPMADFSTVYYEDMEYNQSKWRIQIRPDEKAALFNGYESGGGKIDEERIRFWTRFDKLTAAVFLYWRLHESTNSASQSQVEQYQLDFDNLVASLST